MTATKPSDPSTRGARPTPDLAMPRSVRQRLAAAGSAALAGVLGIAPHVLHHAGPLAGAALFAGSGGTLLFGAIGFLAAIPFLLRVHRRCENWRVPSALLALMVGVFSFSALVVGPAISGSESASAGRTTTNQTTPGGASPTGHAAHHH